MVIITTNPQTLTEETASFSLTWEDDPQYLQSGGEYNLYFDQTLIQQGQYTVQGGGTIIFSNITYQIAGTYDVRVLNIGTGGVPYDVTFPDSLSITCFCENTEILYVSENSEKYKKIEDLKIGEYVKTYLDTPKKITHIYKNTYTNDKTYHQICKISNYPNQTKDLFMTGGHSILADELSESEKQHTLNYWKELKKIKDKTLLLSCVNEKAEKVENSDVYNVYHLVLENENMDGQYGILANGVWCESMSLGCFKEMTKNKLVIM